MVLQGSFRLRSPAKTLSIGLAAIVCFFFANARIYADNIYVSDAASNTIVEYNSNGQGSIFASGLDAPAALAFDESGNLYVANQGNGTIEKFGTNGVGLVFLSGLSNLGGLTFDSRGNLYVMEDATIQKFGTNGVGSLFATTQSTLFGADGLAFDSNSNLYAAVDKMLMGTVEEYNTNGANVGFLSAITGEPFGLAFDSGGNLYISELGGDILKFNSA
jgi:sugar lactone lactonase YvrE